MKGGNKIEKKLYSLLLGLLFIPWLQGSFQFMSEKPLHSDVAAFAVPTLNENNWWSGRYQYHRERFLHRGFGFRPGFVRLHNQLDYWLFNRINAPLVVRGRDGYLFATEDVKTYHGRDVIERDYIESRLQRAAEIRELLRAQGKDLLIVFAVSKARFHPEYLPDESGLGSGTGNYARTLQALHGKGLEYIDFHPVFTVAKDITRCAPFSKRGQFMTHCGAKLAADSLLRCIHQMLGRKAPDLLLQEHGYPGAPFEENDLERQLNLIFPIGEDPNHYPTYGCGSAHIIRRPSVFVLSDGSYLPLVHIGIGQCFDRNSHWCFSSSAWGSYPTGSLKGMSKELLARELEICDLVVVMATDAELSELGWGFFEIAGAMLESGEVRPAEFWKKVHALMDYIPTDSIWMKQIREKALGKGISTDSAILQDAIWMTEQDLK